MKNAAIRKFEGVLNTHLELCYVLLPVHKQFPSVAEKKATLYNFQKFSRNINVEAFS